MISTASARVPATLVAAACLIVASAEAQERPEHFGGLEGTMTVPALSFRGLPSPDGNGFSTFGYPGPGPGNFVIGKAPLQLPNGSQITQLCVVGFDDSWHGEVILQLVGWEYPRLGTPAPTPQRVLATATSGVIEAPGMMTWCATLPAPIVVKSFGDLDGNGVSGWTSYALAGMLRWYPGGGVEPLFGSISFGASIVVWRRTVSAAPAVATFSDVPTWHPQFRYVQALVASGITGGCAVDRFCPDAGITRGQFAVFLSVALGLHYPN